MSTISTETIAKARRLIASAHRIAVLTGAGVSAESGIPTFRGTGGLWRSHRAEDLATPSAFERDPRLVWEWYDWRRGLIAEAKPNAGHDALVTLESRVAEFTLITQNVDGLHRAAGSRQIVHLHGDIWTLRCTTCGAEREDRTVPLPQLPPRCACGGLERPGVVWFGESLPEPEWDRAERATGMANLFLVVGTSAVVWPAAGLATMAIRSKIPVIEVNPSPTELSALELSDRLLSICGPSGEVLPLLVR